MLLRAFGAFADSSVGVAPAAADTFAVIVLDESEAGMPEVDQRSTGFFAETILHVVGNGIGHEERSRKFDERGTLDGLYVCPAISQSGKLPLSRKREGTDGLIQSATLRRSRLIVRHAVFAYLQPRLQYFLDCTAFVDTLVRLVNNVTGNLETVTKMVRPTVICNYKEGVTNQRRRNEQQPRQ